MNCANDFATHIAVGLITVFIIAVYHVSKKVLTIMRTNKCKIDIDKYRSMR